MALIAFFAKPVFITSAKKLKFARNGELDENYKTTTEFYDSWLEVGIIVSDVTKVPSILFPSVELIILKMKVCENFPFILYYAKSNEESISFVWNNWRCPLWKHSFPNYLTKFSEILQGYRLELCACISIDFFSKNVTPS